MTISPDSIPRQTLNDESPVMRLADLPVSSIGKIKYAGKDIWVMRIDDGAKGRDVGLAVCLQTGAVYKGDWAVYAVAPKGSNFTLLVN
jgi:hypothetical protein